MAKTDIAPLRPRRDDGAVTVWFGPARPPDADGLHALYERLSPESRRRRFFQPMPRVPRTIASHLCSVDPDRHLVWLARAGSPSGPVIGEVQLAVDPDDPMAVLLPWFNDAVTRLEKAGISQPILDPGIAFQRQGWDLHAKDRYQRNVIAHLGRLKGYGLPVLIPLPSRTDPDETAQLAKDVMAQQPDLVRTWAPRLAYEALSGSRAR